MFTKSFNDMLQVDVSKHLKTRDGVSYLPWADCKMLLHENGAETVMFYPLPGPDGSTLRRSAAVFSDKNGIQNSCYEVQVHIIVDSLAWDIYYPVLNGNNPVKDNSMSQLRVHNAVRRAFVKGVAERTGLGFKCWLGDEEPDQTDDLSRHSIRSIKERIDQTITAKLQKGARMEDILAVSGISQRQLDKLMASFELIDAFERSLWK